MTPRAVAFDLDSTLAVSKSPVTSEMGALLAQLLATRPVAIMSGARFEQFLTQVLPAIPEDATYENFYLFPNCGGFCYKRSGTEWKALDDHSLSETEQERILHELNRSMEETGFAEPPAQVWGDRIEFRGASFAFSGIGQKAPPEEKSVWDPEKTKRRPLHDLLTERLPDFHIAMNAMTTIDITRKGITKAYAVQKFSELTSVPIQEMFYVGDALFPGGNDEVVIATGIPTRQTSGPAETAHIIEGLLS